MIRPPDAPSGWSVRLGGVNASQSIDTMLQEAMGPHLVLTQLGTAVREGERRTVLVPLDKAIITFMS